MKSSFKMISKFLITVIRSNLKAFSDDYWHIVS